jgi:phage tail sheath protein FI
MPGVYVEEISIGLPSVSDKPSAVPAFVGYTQMAKGKIADDLILKPTRIESLLDYERHFGKAPVVPLEIAVAESRGTYALVDFKTPPIQYLLYASVRLYFENGGGSCYIVSVGRYQNPAEITLTGSKTMAHGLQKGLAALAGKDEPTLLVIPEAVQLSAGDYSLLVRDMLAQCAALRNRFSILDAYDGDAVLNSALLTKNRDYFGSDHLKNGAAYYPFLKSALQYEIQKDGSNVSVSINKAAPKSLAKLKYGNATLYRFVRATITQQSIAIPPSGVVAGIYVAVDRQRGVWKAPANVRLNNIIEPVIPIDRALQQNLNIDPSSGKSINAIRSFSGRGTLVWGARTLAGNDNEWRYIPVRRLCALIKESLINSTHWAVFEPNDANLWIKIRSQIENYLTQKWRDGALQGSTPTKAFYVRCGLGETMTAQDIIDGRLIIEFGLALVRPAEFIVLRFSHRLN